MGWFNSVRFGSVQFGLVWFGVALVALVSSLVNAKTININRCCDAVAVVANNIQAHPALATTGNNK